MQDRLDAGQEICRRGGMQDGGMRDAVQVVCWTGAVQDRWNTGLEGCKAGVMQGRWDAGRVEYRAEEI